MPTIISTTEEMIFVTDDLINGFIIEKPFGRKTEFIWFCEVCNGQEVRTRVLISQLEAVLQVAKKTLSLVIAQHHPFNTPCGNSYPLTRKDVDNLEIILSVSNKSELTKKLMNKKGIIV